MIEQYLRQAEDNLASLEEAAATVGGAVKNLARKLAEQQDKAADLDKAIDAFLRRGEDTAATELHASSLDEQIDRVLERTDIDAQLAERRKRLELSAPGA